MTELGHIWPFCIVAGEYVPKDPSDPKGPGSLPILLCDLDVCDCWYHRSREEIAA